MLVLALAAALWAMAGTGGRGTKVTGRLSAVAAASGSDDPRWQRALAPRPFQFPADHGPHPGFQTEWWYYTGNLVAADGRPFGFQLTFFRRGLDPAPSARASHWATRDVYLAHFTVSDIAGKQFYTAERFSRDGAGLAGAQAAPYRVWLGPWQATGAGPEGMTMRLQAAGDEAAIDLQLESTKPPTLQGDHGLSPKGPSAGNASFYYSLTRMRTSGTLTVHGQKFAITGGTSWMDREWSTSKLEQNAIGWDWFALQLDDRREITWYQLRGRDGRPLAWSAGTLTEADGSTRHLAASDLELQVKDTWTSPRSGARYPASWHMSIPSAGLDIAVTPRMPDQELPVSVIYWEGAVAIKGTVRSASGQSRPVNGYGYVELTGYQQARQASAPR